MGYYILIKRLGGVYDDIDHILLFMNCFPLTGFCHRHWPIRIFV